jgi:hypothetical protein
MKKMLCVTIAILLLCAVRAWAYDPQAAQIKTKTTNFANNLSTADTDVQKALDTIDNLTVSTAEKIELTINGEGSVIEVAASGHKVVPFNCTITKWEITSNTSGSIVVDIKKSTYGTFGTWTSIAGTEKPTLSAATKNTDTSLSTWTTSLSAGDRVQCVVESADITGTVIVTLYVTKN